MDDKQKKLPAGGTTFSAGSFVVGGESFFSSGGDTWEYKIPMVMSRRTKDLKVTRHNNRIKNLRMKTTECESNRQKVKETETDNLKTKGQGFRYHKTQSLRTTWRRSDFGCRSSRS